MRTIITKNENAKYEIKTVRGKTQVVLTDKIVIDPLDFEQRLDVVLLLSNKRKHEIAKQIGMPLTTFTSKCHSDNFTFEEQKKIASAIGCNIIIKICYDDGVEIVAETAKQLVLDACTYKSISMSELATRLKKSRQAVYQKLSRGYFSCYELAEIASATRGKYINIFELEDGMRI